jgi:Na+/melibiose symporter-like transporter
MLPAGLALWRDPASTARHRDRVDWVGLLLLAFFMVTLVHGLHSLAHARTEPAEVIVPLVLAVITLVLLLRVETRCPKPLLDFALFRNRNFALGCALAFLLMFDIMALLLYYNIFAQASDGLGKTPVAAGLSLMPLSVALFGFARMAPWVSGVVGLRRMMVGGSLLLVVGCAVAGASVSGAGFAVLLLGLFVCGAGIALPYASAPKIGLSELPHTQAGKGSGILNSSSFLGGSASPAAGSSSDLPASKGCWRWWGSPRWPAQVWRC